VLLNCKEVIFTVIRLLPTSIERALPMDSGTKTLDKDNMRTKRDDYQD